MNKYDRLIIDIKFIFNTFITTVFVYNNFNSLNAKNLTVYLIINSKKCKRIW